MSEPCAPILAAQLEPEARVADPALLIVDMQNDFVRAGAPLEVPEARATIPAQRRLIENFRRRGLPVVYTRFLSLESDNLLWLWSPQCHPDTRACWPGHLRAYDDADGLLDCAAVIDELEPGPDDVVVDKYGYGSFHGTDLDERLAAARRPIAGRHRHGHPDLRRGDGPGGLPSRVPDDGRRRRRVLLRAGAPRRHARELRHEVRLGRADGHRAGLAVSREAVERLLDQHAIELVRLETPDLNGVSRGKTVTAEHFWRSVDGGLALVSDIFCWDHECRVATGTGFGEDLTFADLSMRPDLSTFALLPHVEGQARVICDMQYSDGRPVEASPRRVLAAPARGCRRARTEGADAGRVRVLSRRPGDAAPPVRRHRHHDHAHEPAPPRATAARARSEGPGAGAADAQPGVGTDAVRAHLRRRRGPGRRRRQLHVQDLREGDRNRARPGRHLHDEAVRGLEREQRPSPPEPLGRRRATSSGTASSRHCRRSSPGRSAGSWSTQPG